LSRPARIWLLTAGEPLPTDPGTVRLYRAGQLAARLRRRGVDVTWWSSTFNHSTKQQRSSASNVVELDDGTRLWQLYGRSYSRNVSVSRLINHWQMAREFERIASREQVPDVIVASWPTPDFAAAATRMAREAGIPSVIDVRDLWPDIFVDVFPSGARWASRAALEPLFRHSRITFAHASNLVAISEPILEWAAHRAGRSVQSGRDRVFHLAYEPRQRSKDHFSGDAVKDVVGHLPPDVHVVCFIGSITRRIELGTMVDAAALLHAEGRRDIAFIVVGVGESLPVLLDKAAGLSNIHFPGWLDGPAIRRLLNRSEFGVLPYPSTPDFVRSYPNKIGEYLSAGLAVLSSTEGLVADLLEQRHCGYRYDARSARSLARTIVAAVDAPLELQRRRDAASTVFAEMFDAETIYSAYADFLIGLVPRARQGPPGARP
jgi:glycosyltransferase involved in cell wall biosynthesis